MSTIYALGIDVGTSGIRAALLAPGEQVVGTASAKMAEFGSDTRDPACWRAALEAALKRLAASHDLRAIRAVAVDGTSGTVLALDRSGAPIGGALMYNDAVDDPTIPAAIAAIAPATSAAHGPASALARALVLQDRPGVARIVHQADWIAEQLADAPLPSDESNALKTGYDPMARRWPDWMDGTPIRRTLLPEVHPAGDRIGTTRAGLGLPPGAAIVAGVTDGCAAFLATGADAPGDGVTSLGTTLTVKLLSDQPVFAPEYGIYSHRIGDMWLAGGASNTGGGVLAAHFPDDALAALSAQIDPNTESGLDYYPLLKPGERFPVNDPALAPRLTPRPEDEAAFLHGILEGIARIERQGYARLAELDAPALRRIRTVGGGAKNPVWQALRARVLGVDEAPTLSGEAAVGVARLALRGLDA